MSTPLGAKYSLLNSISSQEFEKIAYAKSRELLRTNFYIEPALVLNPDNYPDLFCSAENLITYAANEIFSSIDSSQKIRKVIYGYMEKDPAVYARIITEKYKQDPKIENKFWEKFLQHCPLTSQHFDVTFLEMLAFTNVEIAQSVSWILPQIISRKEGELGIFILNSEVLLSLEHLRKKILGIYPENLVINYYLFDAENERINFRLFSNRSHFDYLIFVLQDVRWRAQLLKTKNFLEHREWNVDRSSCFLIEAYKTIENGLKNAMEDKLLWQTEEMVKDSFLESVLSKEPIDHSLALVLIKLKYLDYIVQRKRHDEFFSSDVYQNRVTGIAKKNIFFDRHLNHKDKSLYQFMMMKISEAGDKDKIISDLIQEEGFLFSELVYQSSPTDIAVFIKVLLTSDITKHQLLLLIRASTLLQSYILTSLIGIIEEDKSFREPQIKLLKSVVENIPDVDILCFSNTTLLTLINDESITKLLESALERTLSSGKVLDIYALIDKLSDLESKSQKFISLDIRQNLFLACESGDMVLRYSNFFSDLFLGNEENGLLDSLKVESKIINFYDETLLNFSKQYPDAFIKSAISQFSSIEDGNKLLFILTAFPEIEFNFLITTDMWDKIFSFNIKFKEQPLICRLEKYIIRVNKQSKNTFLDANFKLLCLKNSIYREHFLLSLSESQIKCLEHDISDLITVDLVNINSEILWGFYDKGSHPKTIIEFSLNKLLSSSSDSEIFPSLISTLVRNIYDGKSEVAQNFNEIIEKLELLRTISHSHYFAAFPSAEVKIKDDKTKAFLQNLFLSEVCQREFIENHAQIFPLIFSEKNTSFILTHARDIYRKLFVNNILLPKAHEVFNVNRRLFWMIFDVIGQEDHLVFINNHLLLKDSFLSSWIDETAAHTIVYRLNLLLESNLSQDDKLSHLLKINSKTLLSFIQDINLKVSLVDKHPDFFMALLSVVKREQRCDQLTASDWNKFLTSSSQNLIDYILRDPEFCLHAATIINNSDEKLIKVFLNALSDSENKFFSDKHKTQLRYQNIIKDQLRLLLGAYRSSHELGTITITKADDNLQLLVKIISHQNACEILVQNIFESEFTADSILAAFFDFFSKGLTEENEANYPSASLKDTFIAELFKYGKCLKPHDKKIRFQNVLLDFVRYEKGFAKIILLNNEYSAIVFPDNNKEILSDLLERYMNDSEIIKLILDNEKAEPSLLSSPKFFGPQAKETLKRFNLSMLPSDKLRLFCKKSPVILECVLHSRDLFCLTFGKNSILNKNMGDYLFQLLSSDNADIVNLVLNNAKDTENKFFNFSALSSEQSAALSKHSRCEEIQKLIKLHSPSSQLNALVSTSITELGKVAELSEAAIVNGTQNLTQLTGKFSATSVLKEKELVSDLRKYGYNLFSSSPLKSDSRDTSGTSDSKKLDFSADPTPIAKHVRPSKKSVNSSLKPG